MSLAHMIGSLSPDEKVPLTPTISSFIRPSSDGCSGEASEGGLSMHVICVLSSSRTNLIQPFCVHLTSLASPTIVNSKSFLLYLFLFCQASELLIGRLGRAPLEIIMPLICARRLLKQDWISESFPSVEELPVMSK